MELKIDALKHMGADVILPQFDIEMTKKNTIVNAKWLHFGAGNIFRAYIGKIHQTLLEKKLVDTGIVVAETFDGEIIDKVFLPYDNLTLLVTLDKEGDFKPEIIASIVESINVCRHGESRLQDIFSNPSLQVVSFTITEKGYNLKTTNDEYLEAIMSDFKAGLSRPKHLLTQITALLYKRYKANQTPITLLSMDNCSNNGDRLKDGITTIATQWLLNKMVEQEFCDYLQNEKKVSFPITMIDKITPRPAVEVQRFLENLGFDNMDIVVTDKNAYTAPFVNAEVPEYFVVEDIFPNGRPPLEKVGIILTDRESVEKVERMKVTTCLNPLHTALAIYGCLLNKNTIYECMMDKDLSSLVRKIGYEESLIVVEDPKIINPKAFLDEVLNERFANPYIPDQPQRIATDTSQKIKIRFGETIKAYLANENLDITSLKYIPLVIAGWMRYLMGIDDNGNAMNLSSDPMLDELRSHFKSIKYLELDTYPKGGLNKVLANKDIFGVDLVSIGMAPLIEEYFADMIQRKGGIRQLLQKVLT